jgi:hypothetical protein
VGGRTNSTRASFPASAALNNDLARGTRTERTRFFSFEFFCNCREPWSQRIVLSINILEGWFVFACQSVFAGPGDFASGSVFTSLEEPSGILLYPEGRRHVTYLGPAPFFWFFLCSAAAPSFRVQLEVQMRFEQIIATVARSVAIATVREIEAVVSFVNATCLHLWQQRMPLGMPAYSGCLLVSPFDGDAGWINSADPGSKRGCLRYQPMLALASCPARTARS